MPKKKDDQDLHRDAGLEEQAWYYLDKMFRTQTDSILTFAGVDNWSEKLQTYIHDALGGESAELDKYYLVDDEKLQTPAGPREFVPDETPGDPVERVSIRHFYEEEYDEFDLDVDIDAPMIDEFEAEPMFGRAGQDAEQYAEQQESALDTILQDIADDREQAIKLQDLAEAAEDATFEDNSPPPSPRAAEEDPEELAIRDSEMQAMRDKVSSPEDLVAGDDEAMAAFEAEGVEEPGWFHRGMNRLRTFFSSRKSQMQGILDKSVEMGELVAKGAEIVADPMRLGRDFMENANESLLGNRPAEPDVNLSEVVEGEANLKTLLGTMSKIDASDMVSLSNTGKVFVSHPKLKAWLTKQGKNLALAPVIGPMLAALNIALPGAAGWINTGLAAADLVMTGDPFALAVQGVSEMVKLFNQKAQRHIDNEEPEKLRGKRYGYIREGDTWYPAFVSDDWKGEGLTDTSNGVMVAYGSEILFRPTRSADASATYVQPFVRGVPQYKLLEMTDQALKNKNYTDWLGRMKHYDERDPNSPWVRTAAKESVDNYDMLRNWYFLTDQETIDMLHNPTSFQPYEQDVSNYNPYEKQINDWRRVLELQHEDPNLSEQERAQIGIYDVSSKLRDAVNDGSVLTAASVQNARAARLMHTDDKPDGAGYESNKWGFAGIDTDEAYYEKLMSESNFGRESMPENDWLLKTQFKQAVTMLQKTQLAAAREQGFEERYGYDPFYEYHADYKWRSSAGKTVAKPQELWASLYLDTAKDMDTAQSYDVLNTQIAEINGYDDRSYLQKEYLEQKAIVRYWIDQIGSRGGSEDLLDQMYRKPHSLTGEDPGDLKMMLGSVYDYQRIMDEGEKWHDDPYLQALDKGGRQAMSNTAGWIMPWQNAGESILPDDARVSILGKTYADELERLGDEARENASKWIEKHGKLDPNLLLDGYEEDLTDRDILDSVEDAYDKWKREQIEEEAKKAWDPEGVVPEGEEPWDEVQHKYVKPGDQTPGTVYDAESHSYIAQDDDDDKVDDGKVEDDPVGGVQLVDYDPDEWVEPIVVDDGGDEDDFFDSFVGAPVWDENLGEWVDPEDVTDVTVTVEEEEETDDDDPGHVRYDEFLDELVEQHMDLWSMSPYDLRYLYLQRRAAALAIKKAKYDAMRQDAQIRAAEFEAGRAASDAAKQRERERVAGRKRDLQEYKMHFAREHPIPDNPGFVPDPDQKKPGVIPDPNVPKTPGQVFTHATGPDFWTDPKLEAYFTAMEQGLPGHGKAAADPNQAYFDQMEKGLDLHPAVSQAHIKVI